MTLPGIIPRLRQFARTGFGCLAHLMAVVYYAVRLLPPGHPYTNPANIGRFGIRHVIGEASRHLILKKENIDQIIIFIALLAGFVLLVAQFALVVVYFIVKPAFAAVMFAGMFSTAAPTNDIAFMMLDSVFGVPGLFTDSTGAITTCVAALTNCGGAFPALTSFPMPFHDAMHRLFHFYNLAVLVVAILVFLYYVLIMVAETAHTGSPFGRRFNHIWAPLRLVVALGLLIPLNYGFNSAQYIMLYAAKLGSSFATNGWNLFIASLNDGLGMNNIAGQPNYYVAEPIMPEVNSVINFMLLVTACEVAYESQFSVDDPATPYDDRLEIEPYLVKDTMAAVPITGVGTPAWGGAPPTPWTAAGTALNFYGGDDIIIRFGANGRLDPGGTAINPERYPNATSGVFPFCGEITIHTKDLAMPGAIDVQRMYYDWIAQIWYGARFGSPVLPGPSPIRYIYFANRFRCMYGPEKGAQRSPLPGWPANHYDCNAAPTWFSMFGPDTADIAPPFQWYQALVREEYTYMSQQVATAYSNLIAALPAMMSTSKTDITGRGWAGAGMWYNTIAQWNGSMFTAVTHIPTPSRMPAVMDKVENTRRSHNESTSSMDRYTPNIRGNAQAINYDLPEESFIAQELYHVYQYVLGNGDISVETQASGNWFYDTVNFVFGTDGLFDMRENDSVNPMAQLVAVGKSMVDAAIRNMGLALGFSVGGGSQEASAPHIGQAGNLASSAIVALTTIGLSIGFLLYYVLPFLPFIYFFFALGTWVKSIFEAMVGAPLWALAHLRVDGNGLPSETAMNGYFMVMEIFLRPILSVFGLLASVIIFSAMARTLNGLFDLVIQNLTGFECDASNPGCGTLQAGAYASKRAVVDEFFFTILYAVLVYLIAVSSFKLIDQVPDHIMRWMGTGVKSFGGQDGDPAQGLTQYAAFGGANIAGQVAQGAAQGGRLAGQGVGTLQKLIMDNIPGGAVNRTVSGGGP